MLYYSAADGGITLEWVCAESIHFLVSITIRPYYTNLVGPMHKRQSYNISICSKNCINIKILIYNNILIAVFTHSLYNLYLFYLINVLPIYCLVQINQTSQLIK